MRNFVFFLKPLAVSVMALVLGCPALSYAQCNWVFAPNCGPGSSGPYQSCSRIVNPSDACNLDSNAGNGTICSDSGAFSGVNLIASQTNSAFQASAFCNWGCGAEDCIVRLSDGLPVELMDFSIE